VCSSRNMVGASPWFAASRHRGTPGAIEHSRGCALSWLGHWGCRWARELGGSIRGVKLMGDRGKTKAQLAKELAEWRRRLVVSEAADVRLMVVAEEEKRAAVYRPRPFVRHAGSITCWSPEVPCPPTSVSRYLPQPPDPEAMPGRTLTSFAPACQHLVPYLRLVPRPG